MLVFFPGRKFIQHLGVQASLGKVKALMSHRLKLLCAPKRQGPGGSSTGCNQLLRLAFDKPLLADSVDLRGSWDETTMPRMAV